MGTHGDRNLAHFALPDEFQNLRMGLDILVKAHASIDDLFFTERSKLLRSGTSIDPSKALRTRLPDANTSAS